MKSKLTCFIKEEGILILLHVLGGSGFIQEQRVNPFDVLHLNFCPLRRPNIYNFSTAGCRSSYDVFFLHALQLLVKPELTLRLRQTSPAVLISWMA